MYRNDNYVWQEGYDEGYRKGYSDGMTHLQEKIAHNLLEEAAEIKIDRRLDKSELVRQIQEKMR